MPGEPKKKHSKAVKRIRRASIKLGGVKLVICSHCQQKTIAHMACSNCGFYKDQPVSQSKTRATVTRA